jgi:hypothetical protein
MKECEDRQDLANRHGVNIITHKICADREKVIRLGQIKVDMMNRMPADLLTEEWSVFKIPPKTQASNHPVSDARTFIDIASLFHWKVHHSPKVNLDALCLSTHASDTVWTQCVYCKPIPAAVRAKSVIFNRGSIVGVWIPTPNTSQRYGSNAAVNMTMMISWSESVDQEKVKDIREFSGYGIFTSAVRDTNGTDEQKDAQEIGARIGKEILFQLVGHIGSREAFSRMHDDMRKAYLVSNRSSIYRSRLGPYNNAMLWQTPQRGESNKINVQLNSAVYQNLEWPDAQKKWIGLSTYVDDRACLAFILQASYHALADKADLLNTIFALFKAAQALEDGLLTKEDVINSYCSCGSHEARSSTEHLCMLCFAVRPCMHMQWHEWDSCLFFVCRPCANKSATQISIPPRNSAAVISLSNGRFIRGLSFQLRVAVRNLHSRDSKHGTPPWTIDELHAHLLDKHAVPGNSNAWLDGYRTQNDQISLLSDAIWPEELIDEVAMVGNTVGQSCVKYTGLSRCKNHRISFPINTALAV